jgi:hypothetical protein
MLVKKNILGWDRLRVQNKGINQRRIFLAFGYFWYVTLHEKNRKLIENDILRYHIHAIDTRSVGVICSQNLELISSGVQVWGTRSAVDTSENPEKV